MALCEANPTVKGKKMGGLHTSLFQHAEAYSTMALGWAMKPGLMRCACWMLPQPYPSAIATFAGVGLRKNSALSEPSGTACHLLLWTWPSTQSGRLIPTTRMLCHGSVDNTSKRFFLATAS